MPSKERAAVAVGTAVIVGVGPGLGVALARAFAGAGHPVAMLDRDEAGLGNDVDELASTGQPSADLRSAEGRTCLVSLWRASFAAGAPTRGHVAERAASAGP